MNDIASRADLESLLRSFYDRALLDPLLRRVFVEVAHMDLDAHLPIICDFWNRVLFNEGVYNGRTMHVHRQLHSLHTLHQAHFDRWLQLWNEALDDNFEGPVTEQARRHAARMAAVFLRQLNEARPVLRPLRIVPTRVAG